MPDVPEQLFPDQAVQDQPGDIIIPEMEPQVRRKPKYVVLGAAAGGR